jgi:hypothetical protein
VTGPLFGAGLGAFCAAVSFWSAFDTGRPSHLVAGLAFTLFSVVWYQCLPRDFFTRPLRQLAHALPEQTAAQQAMGLAAVVLLFLSLAMRWFAGL